MHHRRMIILQISDIIIDHHIIIIIKAIVVRGKNHLVKEIVQIVGVDIATLDLEMKLPKESMIEKGLIQDD